MLTIDAHQHFWHYTAEEYAWIDDTMPILRRDFLPADLQAATEGCGIDGVVTVQARQTMKETHWLLDLASRNEFIRGVVGWCPLLDPRLRDILEPLSKNEKLKAVRHVLQDEPDERYVLRDDFNLGVSQLKEFDLAYDILVFERHLPHVIEFVKRHPNQIFVLDHMAKPRIRDGALSPWRENLNRLAEFPNVCCKISGMVTEADHDAWRDEDLVPYFDVVLKAFGPQRLLFGSDWPVCLTATTYRRWFSVVRKQIAALSASEQGAILGGTAARVYRL